MVGVEPRISDNNSARHFFDAVMRVQWPIGLLMTSSIGQGGIDRSSGVIVPVHAADIRFTPGNVSDHAQAQVFSL